MGDSRMVPAWSRPQQPQEMSEYEYRLYKDQLERHQAQLGRIAQQAHGLMDLERNAREVAQLGRICLTQRRTRQFKRHEADAEVRNANARLVKRIMDVAKQGEKRIQRAARPLPIAGPESMNENLRRRQASEIDIQNSKLLQRIKGAKPCVPTAAACEVLRHPRHSRFKQRSAEDGGQQPHPPPKPPPMPRPSKPNGRRVHGDAVSSGRGSRASKAPESPVRLPPIDRRPPNSSQHPSTQISPSRALPVRGQPQKSNQSEKRVSPKSSPSGQAAPMSAVVAAVATHEAICSPPFFVTAAEDEDPSEDVSPSVGSKDEAGESVATEAAKPPWWKQPKAKPSPKAQSDQSKSSPGNAGDVSGTSPKECAPQSKDSPVSERDPTPSKHSPVSLKSPSKEGVTPQSGVFREVFDGRAQGDDPDGELGDDEGEETFDDDFEHESDSEDEEAKKGAESQGAPSSPGSKGRKAASSEGTPHAGAGQVMKSTDDLPRQQVEDVPSPSEKLVDEMENSSSSASPSPGKLVAAQATPALSQDNEPAGIESPHPASSSKDVQSKQNEAPSSFERPRPPPIDVPNSPSHREDEDEDGALTEGFVADAEEEEAARREIDEHQQGHSSGYESGSVDLENEQHEFPAYSDDEFNSESEKEQSKSMQ